MSKQPILISVEGNIGSGKSTLVETLKTVFENRNDIHFLDEPVEEWNLIKDTDGKNIIEKYYENQEKYAFQFQMMAYISRISLLRNALRNDKIKIIVTERSIFTDLNVFAQMLYDDKKISEIEFSIYKKWFNEFIQDVPKLNIIYLKTNPDIALERVNKRNRPGEVISIDYLDRCNQYHNKWLDNNSDYINNLLTLNGNENIEQEPHVINDWTFNIIEFIEKIINNISLGRVPENLRYEN